VLEVGSDSQRALIRQAIETGDADFGAVAQAIFDTKALDHARESAQREADLARQALDVLPISPSRQSLIEFCAFALSRDN